MKIYAGVPQRFKPKRAKRATAASHVRKEISAKSAAAKEDMLRRANKIYEDSLLAIDALAEATGFKRNEIAQVAFGYKKMTLTRAPSLFNACVRKLMKAENDREYFRFFHFMSSHLI